MVGADDCEDRCQSRTEDHFGGPWPSQCVKFVHDGCTNPEHGQVVADLGLILECEMEDKRGRSHEEES